MTGIMHRIARNARRLWCLAFHDLVFVRFTRYDDAAGCYDRTYFCFHCCEYRYSHVGPKDCGR